MHVSKCVDMCVHVGLKQVVHIVYVFTLHAQLPIKCKFSSYFQIILFEKGEDLFATH